MPILTQKALVLAKVETTAGVDAVPVATTDAFLCMDPIFSVDITNLERQFARPDFSQYASRIGRKLAHVAFSIQLCGGNAAGVEPTWATLFRGCAMAKSSLVTPNRIKFTPLTTGQETLTLYVYYEGLLHKITGSMGSFTIDAAAGQYGMIHFMFTGLYNTPINSTYPATVTVQDVIPPQVELATLAYGGDATLIVDSFKMDMGNKVVARSDVNSANGYKNMRISGRDCKGGFDPELEQTTAFWTQLEANTLSAFIMVFGSVAGNKIQLDAPKAQIVGITYADRENLRMQDLSLEFRRNAGDDEFTITFY